VGRYGGEEIVQLYIRDLVGSVTRPVLELKAFEKVSLEPGQTKAVQFKLGLKDLEFLDIDMKLVAEPGEFEVFVGTSSRDTKSVKFTLTD
jgi:beta-glucosidase